MKKRLRRRRRTLRAIWGRFRQTWKLREASVTRLLRRLARRIWTWCRSRRAAHLLQGLPAVIAAGTALVFLFLAVQARGERTGQYRSVAAAAFQSGDYALARVAYERLVLLDDTRPEFRYELALTEAAQGNLARAVPLMETLAPLDRQGYAPAHIWLARAHLARGAQPASRQAAEIHARRALQELPNDADANGLIGHLYLVTGRPELAEPPLLRAAAVYPEADLDLARLYAGQNKRDLARAHGERAQRYFGKRVEARLDDHDARLSLADAQMLAGDFPGAVAVLHEGLTLAPNAGFHDWLARAYLLWSDDVARPPNADSAKQLALLEKALAFEAAAPLVLDRLLALTRRKGTDADKARTALRVLLAEGKSPALVHVALAIDAYELGMPDEALLHFEQAHQLAPDMPLVLNNLAWMLARASLPDLPRALKLVDAALARSPNQPRFRDTRGQILVKMGRWKEALADLEAALPALPKDADLHRALAEAYEHLGMTDMAAQHKRLAEKKEQ